MTTSDRRHSYLGVREHPKVAEMRVRAVIVPRSVRSYTGSTIEGHMRVPHTRCVSRKLYVGQQLLAGKMSNELTGEGLAGTSAAIREDAMSNAVSK